MGKISGVSWTDASWSPWYGCEKVSPGCGNCYAQRDMERYGKDFSTVQRAKTTFNDPLHWREPKKIFVTPWSDFFLEEADPWRNEAWDIIRHCKQHTFQLCTKRADQIMADLPEDWGRGWDNVWLGVTVETPKYLSRVDQLLDVPAMTRFVSYEPALASLTDDPHSQILWCMDWIISGGESGPKARKADPEWFRQIRDFCKQEEVAFFHKQNGGTQKINGSWGGDTIDDKQYKEFPDAW
jgi:protein gp37